MCAPEVSGHATLLESAYGTPTVGVHADVFATLVDSVAKVNGIPNQRRAFVPTPVINQSKEQLRAYVGGDDPTTGRPFIQEIFTALTRRGTEDQGLAEDRAAARFVDTDDSKDVEQLFRDNHWTDYLPIVLPTEERVAAMLQGTSRKPDELVGRLRPTHFREAWDFDVEKVAVNAVMAGARPEHLPVILALASSGITARYSSTSSAAAMAVVNGPIRGEIGMNSGIGALGPYNEANAVIGRAFGLLSQNLQGGSVPLDTYVGSQGNNHSYNNLTFAENEEASPWLPLSRDRGFDESASTATVFLTWGNSATEGLRGSWRSKLVNILRALDPWHGVILLFDPIVADELTQLGFDTKDKLKDWIHEHVLVEAELYWETYTSINHLRPHAKKGEEPYATYYQAEPKDLIPVFEKDVIEVAVVGGATNGMWTAFSGRELPTDLKIDPTSSSTVSVDAWR